MKISLAFALLPAALFAQWPNYEAGPVPKGPDGKPNLEAPTPKTADGKPDLTGIWENFRRENGQQSKKAGQSTGTQPLSLFRDIGAGVEGGLPIKPEAAQLKKLRMADNSKDNPDAKCLPMGFMQFHIHPQPRKIVQTPGVIVIMYEANAGMRQIFTDGRPLPDPKNVQPWWYGYSVGKWEGDTLVVTTVGLRDGGWLDINGSPYTDAAKITEKFKRLNFGTLEVEITVDDPKAYTKPWTVTLYQRILVGGELIEFVCNENDTSPTHMVGK